MRRSTKKSITAIIIILIFGMSSIAFVATGFFGTPQATQQFKQLDSFIVEGDVDILTEDTYIQNGYTWIKYYYTEIDSNDITLMNSLPTSFPAGNQPQIVVQKLNQEYLTEPKYVIITSLLGQESFSNVDANEIFDALCKILVSTPPECGLRNFTAST